jgi:HEAT repeat protein
MGLFGLLKPNVEKLKAKHDVQGLIKALDYGKDFSVRKQAAAALGEVGDDRAVEPLITALEGLGGVLVELSMAAATALGQLQDKRALDPLVKALKRKDLDPNIRQILELQGAPEARLKDLANSLSGVRLVAAHALGQLKDARAVEPLVSALGDDAPAVARNAADALARIGEPSIRPLAGLLTQANPKTRRSAARALSQINSPQAAQALHDAARSTADEEVRGYAVLAPCQSGWRPPLNALLEEFREISTLLMEADIGKALDQYLAGGKVDRKDVPLEAAKGTTAVLAAKYGLSAKEVEAFMDSSMSVQRRM